MKRMRGGRSWKLFAVIGAVVTTVTVGLVATTASAKSDQDVNLTVSLFGDFGYHDLYKKYEKAHPGVTIKESIQDYGTHHTQLAQRIAVGAGAADIEAIEVGFIPQFTPQPQNFVDLRTVRRVCAEEALPAVEVGAGRRQGRRGRRSRH